MELGKYILYIHKKLRGDLNAEEKNSLEAWLSEGDNAKVESDLNRIWNASNAYKEDYTPDTNESWGAFSAKMKSEKENNSERRLRVASRKGLRVAAAVLFLIAATFVWQSIEGQPKTIEISSVFGETKTFSLPDGTEVVLNENSALTYSSDWQNLHSRSVHLHGEAYFDVTKNPERPFKISTEKIQVEVLGTAFNLRAYPNEYFSEVAVSEGRVRFSKSDLSEELILSLDEVGRLEHRENKLSTIESSAFNANYWRTGEFSFRDTPMSEIAQTLERHFPVKIRFANKQLTSCPYTGDFSQDDLSNILKVLEVGLGFNIEKRSQDTYVFSGGYCEGNE